MNQSRYKVVHVWALEKNLDVTGVVSNTFALEWPKNSGKVREYPEVDRAGWFDIELAKKKIRKEQIGFIYRLMDTMNYSKKNNIPAKKKIQTDNTILMLTRFSQIYFSKK